MHNITIGRYKPNEAVATRIHCDVDGTEVSRELVQAHTGWIEGVRDDGTTWVMFMDDRGNPLMFWPQREPDGTVRGNPIELS